MKLKAWTSLLLILAPPAHAERQEQASLGRLLFAPAQRLEREALRHPVPARGPAARQESVRLDGIVRRKGAPALVWINGDLLTDHARITGVEAEALRIIAADGVSHRIGVGETLLLEADAAR